MNNLEFFLILLFLVAFSFAGLQKVSKHRAETLISKDTSVILKAVCCIIIVTGHYAQHFDGAVVFKQQGNVALIIFLLLSAYGICKSEMRGTLNVTDFLKHRVGKLLIPYAVSMLIFIAFYWCLPYISDNQLSTISTGGGFKSVTMHTIGVIDVLKFLTGLKSLNGAMWFVGVTLFNYVAFQMSKSFFSIYSRREAFLLLYSSFLGTFAIATWSLDFPAHYWRNLWPLQLGMVLALYEKELMAFTRRKWLLFFIITEIYMIAYIRLSRSAGFEYILCANTAFIMLFVLYHVSCRYSLRRGSLIMRLSAVSYGVYLVHCYFQPVARWYNIYYPCTLWILVSIICAYAVHTISKYLYFK